MMVKVDSLLEYTPVLSYITLNSRIENVLLTKMSKSLRHSSFIEMVHNVDRAKHEQNFLSKF